MYVFPRLIASDDYYRLVYAALARLPPHRHLLLPPIALLESPTHFYIVRFPLFLRFGCRSLCIVVDRARWDFAGVWTDFNVHTRKARAHVLPTHQSLGIRVLRFVPQVMELCHGRDLVEYVLNHPPGGIATSSCRRLMQQLLLGVHFLHSYNVSVLFLY